MHVRIDISESAEAALRQEWGDLDRAAKEALLIESYRTGKVSLGFLAETLGMGVIEADRWLAERNVPLNYTYDDLQKDIATLAERFPELRR